jgi:hypothetical protein
MRSWPTARHVAIATVLLLAGCGGGATGGDDPREPVVDAARDYQTAVLDEDAESYCDALTGAAKEEIISTTAPLGGPTSCAGSAKRIFDLAGKDDLEGIRSARDALKSENARVRGNKATVKLLSGRKLKLSRAGDAWLIADPTPTRK